MYAGKAIFVFYATGFRLEIEKRYKMSSGKTLVHLSDNPVFSKKQCSFQFARTSGWKKPFEAVLSR